MTPVITCHESQLLPASEAIHHHAALETAVEKTVSTDPGEWRIVGSCCLFGPKLRTKHNRKATVAMLAKQMFVSIICHTRNCWTSIFNLWKCQHAITAGMRWLSWWNDSDSVKNKSLAQPGKSRTQYHQYLNGKLIYCHCLLSTSDISLYIQIWSFSRQDRISI